MPALAARLALALLLSPLLATLMLGGCDGGSASSRSGLDARMRLGGAQFVPGPMPASDPAGPVLTALQTASSRIRPGEINKPLSGRAGKGGVGVAFGLEGDAGYWLLPVLIEDAQFEGEFTFSSSASFSRGLTLGSHKLIGKAVDDQGRFGAENNLALEVVSLVPVTADLVISLLWNENSDLDLHVVPPSTDANPRTEIWSRKATSYKPPAPPDLPDPAAIAASGYLDFDSNAQCNIDGRRAENVIWKKAAPSGHYLVRVDTYSLCAESLSRWQINVFSGVSDTNPVVIDYQTNTVVTDPDAEPKGPKAVPLANSSVTGLSFDTDARLPHQAGSGTLALEFDVP